MREPWDLLRGRDVFTQKIALSNELGSTLIRHWAPNCSTFSRAREKPIPGVKFSPKPLRNDLFPNGIPEALEKLPATKRRKVILDTEMAEMAANDCIQAHLSHRYFSLEHPRNSIARRLESWERLEGLEGVYKTEYHACMFEGCSRRKAQILIHNISTLDGEIGLTCTSDKKCSRTGKPHLPWKPLVKDGKVVAFPTGEEREYSDGFCRAYARGLGEQFGDREDRSFLEIFSGPNAPLSRAIAVAWGESPPDKMEKVGDKGVFTEFSEDTQLRFPDKRLPEFHAEDSHSHEGKTLQDPPPAEQRCPEENPYRAAAVQAAKQPSYGKRVQLIADGLDSPEEHMRRAKLLEHPFDSLSLLKEDHSRVVSLISQNPTELVARRFEALDKLKSWASDLESEQAKANRRASWTAKKLGLKPKTELMRRLQDLLNIEDKEVPNACLLGLRITGPASESRFFENFEVPPVMSFEDFHSKKMERSKQMIDRVEYMATKGSPELAKAIWGKTMKEVSKGTMGPPMTLDQVRTLYKDDFQVTPSFGLEQGTNEHGQPKFRRIDDHTASGVNQFSKRRQKVPMAMVDYVGVMVRAIAQSCSSVYMCTEDMQGAYRQVPLHPSDVKYAIAGVYDPSGRKVALFEMYGQPFGAGHAVPNFCRVSEWISRMLQRFFHLHVEHFFDDFSSLKARRPSNRGLL